MYLALKIPCPAEPLGLFTVQDMKSFFSKPFV